MLDEIRLLSTLSHDNIVGYLGSGVIDETLMVCLCTWEVGSSTGGPGGLNSKPAPKSAAEFDQFRRFVLPICWVSELRRFVLPVCGVSVIWLIRSADLLGFLGF